MTTRRDVLSRSFGSTVNIRTVGIYDEEQGLFVADKFRILRRNEQIFHTGDRADLVLQALNSAALMAYDDMDPLARNTSHMGNADGSANAVVVLPFVPHDKDHAAVFD